MISAEKISSVSENNFNELALQIFSIQAEQNEVYKEFLSLQKINPKEITTVYQIPFLPVELFKTHKIVTGNSNTQIVFTSSGTTGQQSRHFVTDISVYEKSFLKGFEFSYGSPEQYCFLALLPSYLERKGSSLIYMTEELIRKSNHSLSGFFLDDFNELENRLRTLESQRQKTILLGVSYALLDFAKEHSFPLSNTIIMETGGMKGKRKEITREEFHQELKNSFNLSSIHSEYGMSELLSQAYSKSNGKFFSPPWMKVLVRDINDPFQILADNQTGVLNIIDLSNINSCSFLATSDLGKINNDGSFEVLGRIDNSDIRGCNLMVE